MNKREAAPWLAANKFGLGLRPGERSDVARDPRGWLKQQLRMIGTVPVALQGFDATPKLVVEARKLQKRMVDQRRKLDQPGGQAEYQRLQKVFGETQEAQQKARMLAAIDTPAPFAERLVRFWSNHFAVVVGGGSFKEILRHIAVPYENEAIRPNLERNFADLLLAVEQHPAMQLYLDNFLSVGPNSKTGKARDRGLNENLAREILELHTLGVDGGYTQEDVTSLSRILTGWGVDLRYNVGPERYGASYPGAYRFDLDLHEPGAHTLLGKIYASQGEQQGEAALRDLAHHPATARHIARKLVKHFVADTPPESAVKKIEQTFNDTGGWLPAVHEALVDLDEAWEPAPRKFKTPEELVVSVARACDLPERSENPPLVLQSLNRVLRTFGQRQFYAGSPAGWPDVAASWGNPDAVLKRIEWLSALPRAIPAGLDPLELRDEILPRNATLWREIDGAESVNQALVLLFASPSFQWRGV
jgi:uncharacterized protein (DUF1800 family)